MVDAEDFKTTGNAGVVPGIKGSSKEAFPLNKTNRKKEIGRGNRRKMKNLTNKFISAGMALAVLSMTSGLPFGAADALAKPKTNTISAVPTVTHVTVVGGKLVAEGYATATIKGQTYTVPFSGVPVDLTRVSADRLQQLIDQGRVTAQQASVCPVLDLMLGPIDLNLLGLRVQTSPICLTITAFENGGLLEVFCVA